MKCAVEVGSSAVMYLPIFIRIGSDIEKLIWGYTDTQTAW
jgi:hypothetical protein